MLIAGPAHAATGNVSDTTVADFAAGTPGAGTYVSETADGEVLLNPTVGAEFYGPGLPLGWTSTPVIIGGDASVQGGALEADGARVTTDTAYGPGRSVEFVATFSAAPRQSAGFSEPAAPEGARWAMFDTGATGTDLSARTNIGDGIFHDTVVAGSFLGAPHRYRIAWNLTGVEFFVDGALVAAHSVTPVLDMRPFAADEWLDATNVRLDWLRMTPYASSGSFLSRIFDAGRRVDWESLSWTGDAPAGTGTTLSARTGDTPTPDGTWTSFGSIAGSGDPVGQTARYIQYQAGLSSSDAATTPGLADVTISYTDTTAPAVQVDSVSDALIGPTDTGTDVTWHADEDGIYSVRIGGAGCADGTEVAGGAYSGAPAQQTTTVSAGDLAEGANTIRVCVTDTAGNAGSTTTSVVKDTTAPAIVIDVLSDSLIGSSDTGTSVTWHANQDGTYSVRVYDVGFPDPGCPAGTEVESGSYSGAPAPRVTPVAASILLEGLDAIRICVTDAAGNQGSEVVYVVKDVTAPTIAIDTVSDDPVGPADSSTTVTWHANADGPYSVRVGGTNCSTGSVAASGAYDTAPRPHATTVSTSLLVEGSNQIRVCVADVFGNQASNTTSVTKDLTAPNVTIDNVSDTLIGPADPDTDVTWHAGENGPYSVRVGGTSCSTGTEVASGSYAGAPTQHTTTVSATQLSEGTNTIRVCVGDAAGNQGEQITSVVKDTTQSTTLTFGPEADARVEEANPTTNFGTSSTLYVEGGSALDRHSYLRFQLTGLVGTVEEAKLRLWVTNGTADGPAVHLTDWVGAENVITWSNRPAATSGPHDDKQALGLGAWVEYDVTSLVSGNGTKSFVLIGTSSDSLGVASRETGTASQRPELVVTAVTYGSDFEPPSPPTGLSATAAGPTRVDLDWTAATDNVGVTGYRIYRDGSLLTTVDDDPTSYADTTVVAETEYDYQVRALDGAGNVSDPSNEATVTTPAPGPDPIIMAAGDQACDPTHSSFNGGLGSTTSCRQKYTSDLVVNQGLAAVLVLGDNQYECGGYDAFLQSYHPSWGRVKSITYPALGNHEYHTTGGLDCDPSGAAAGYFSYFGAAAGDPTKGYYSFNLGTWHVIALNSNCSIVSCSASSAQASWLQADLAANPSTCTLAFWHHPKFTSGTNSPGSNSVKPLFQILYNHKADVGLVGHDHDYERFALKDPEGALQPSRGIRQIVVGTGGRSFHNWGTIQPGSEARQNDTFGVLKLTLRPDSYQWQFVPEAGKTYTDTGSAPCVV